MSRRKNIYSLEDTDEIRQLLEEMSETNDEDYPSSEEDESDPLHGIDLEDENDPDFVAEDDDGELSTDSEDEVEPFDEEEVEVSIGNVIMNCEKSSEPEPSTSAKLARDPTSTNSNETNKKKKPNDKKSGDKGKTGNKRTEKQSNEEDELILKLDGDKITGRERKDGSVFVWKTTPLSKSGKTPRRNVVHVTPGPVGPAREVTEPIDCFLLFVTLEMVEMIKKHTNEQIKRSRKKEGGTFSEIESTEELLALFGLFIYGAAKKDNHLSTSILFNSNQCGTWYKAAMSKCRFEFLVSCIRFDDKTVRDPKDKFGLISEIWNTFIENCRKNYKPGSYCTIDEQLVGFRGNCPFRVYIPNKPAKYGLKVIAIVDSGTKYLFDAIPYTGKGTTPPDEPVAPYIVKTLVETIKNTQRNVTFDNWFTSVPLASDLLQKGITCIGTIRKNKIELPPQFVDLKFQGRKVGSSLFLYHDDITAVSYKAKTNKMVTLISTMHDEPDLHPYSKKPQIIHSYNATKGGVDTLDQLCSNYSCNRKTKRWPLCFFYNIINVACVNSYVIYKHNFFRRQEQKQNGSKTGTMQTAGRNRQTISENRDSQTAKRLKVIQDKAEKPLTRLEFMLKLNEQLSHRWKMMRLEKNPKFSATLKVAIQGNLNMSAHPHPCSTSDSGGLTLSEPVEESTTSAPPPADSQSAPTTAKQKPAKRMYCSLCPSSLKRKTSTTCSRCDRLICGGHTAKKLCSNC